MKNKSNHNNFKIANINEKEELAIKKAENLVKEETGKEFVMIAWQQDDTTH